MSNTKEGNVANASAIRSELEAMVVGDLLGPGGGEEEELIEPPGLRYFVGVLAPRQTTLSGRAGSTGRDGGSGAKYKDADYGDLFPEETIEEGILDGDDLAVGGRDSGDDGSTDRAPAQRKALIPSSIGMTFTVRGDVKKLKVTATWGQYLKEVSEEKIDEKTGNPLRIWKRHPRGGEPKEIALVEGKIKSIICDTECPDVVVQGRIRKREDHWNVTLFFVNQQAERDSLKDQAWVFQPELAVEAEDGSPIFEKKHHRVDLGGTDPAVVAESGMLEMLYRKHVEFAVGHGVGVNVRVSDDPNFAVRVSTAVVPSYEVPQTTPSGVADAGQNPAFAKLEGLVLDMKVLAEAPREKLKASLEPIVRAYADWIDREEKRVGDASQGLKAHEDAAKSAIKRCKMALQRIRDGIELVSKDDTACQAFKFANRAMWLQRTHSIFAEKKRRDEEPDYQKIDIPKNRTWYPFQLAFILLNLPGLTELGHEERSEKASAAADLLWFPTGGGKTEAYLGLTAYTLAMRRLQGEVDGRDGENGVAVLMRYTLRLLTIQQFQRAAALICACEDIRRSALSQGDDRWGKTPFRLGLWVGGKVTPNRNEDAAEVVKGNRAPRRGAGQMGQVGSPHQIRNCPWCGSKIEPDKHIVVENFAQGHCRTLVFCGDTYGQCLFSKKQSPGEGLPLIVVDEEIYRRLPSLLITTVDKFAQMTWNGAVQMLFGQVNGYCERHGFRSPEIEDSDSHPKRNALPAAKTVPRTPLRPPDLIIQDELHLISGPLGTLVGLYETAIDKLCTWEVGGKKVRPKVIASTATIRRAQDQIHSLFLRGVQVFPPQGLDIGDNFFSLQRPPSEEKPGRKYIGICAPGRRLKAALIRTYVALLSAGQVLFDKYGAAADPWMTMIGYFNSLRELGGMKRLVDDDVRTRLQFMIDRGLANRRLYTPDTVQELTSRLGSTAIPEILDLMEVRWDPADLPKRGKKSATGKFRPRPLDVVLATSMISVGVDVPRLGLMTVAGQPKSTAEYIQASSRVGRREPGIVVTVLNWARPRDLSHYETFEHYHATFYKHVEPLSVTPFSPGAIYRGLAGLLVSLIRMSGEEFNENQLAEAMKDQRNHAYVKEAVAAIVRRAELVKGPGVAKDVEKQLKRKLDQWQKKAMGVTGGSRLGYKDKRDGVTIGLLKKPGLERWTEFTCLNSLREVEPPANLVLDDHHLDDEQPADAVAEGVADDS